MPNSGFTEFGQQALDGLIAASYVDALGCDLNFVVLRREFSVDPQSDRPILLHRKENAGQFVDGSEEGSCGATNG